MNLHDIIAENKPQLVGILIGAMTTLTILGLLVGRKKFTWLTKEFVKMYSSNQKSWFSKKRMESGIAFIIAEHGAMFWLAKKYNEMSTSDFGIWISIQLAVAGWMVNQIQKEKKFNPSDDDGDGNNNSNSAPVNPPPATTESVNINVSTAPNTVSNTAPSNTTTGNGNNI